MCRLIEIRKGAVPSNITIEFERDASLRAVEVLVVNRDRSGRERDGVVLFCEDSGRITPGPVAELADGVGMQVPVPAPRPR